MFVEVIPRMHSIGFRPLTYSVGDVFEGQISLGCLVQIPLGKKDEIGLVTKINEGIPLFRGTLKPIGGIICPHEILAPYQIKLIQNIAHHSMIPIYKVLAIFLSQAVMNRLEKKGFPIFYKKDKTKKDGKLHIKISKDSIIDKKILEEYIQAKTVILCPDDFMLYRLERELSSIYPDAVFLPGEASDTKKARIWIELAEGKHSIIFGTRKVLYYNLDTFEHIVYLEDAFYSEYYHYPTKIRYHDILSFLEKQSCFDITILTSIPKLETLHRFRDSIITYI